MNHQQIEEEDIIDRYLIRKLPPELESEFEDHFLNCPECTDKLERSREAVFLLAESRAAEHPAAARTQPGKEPSLLIPLPAWGLALALSVVAIFISMNRTPVGPEREARRANADQAAPAQVAPAPVVQLDSYRAGDGSVPVINEAIAAKAFRLRLDLRGVPAYEQYSVQIVGDTGALVWSLEGLERRESEWLESPVEDARLAPGSYWVRLFGWRAGAEHELLREYGLTVAR